MKKNHLYRVSVYLGKDNYAKLDDMAKFFGIPLASIVRVLIENGIAFGEMMEKGEKNGWSK